MSSPPPVPEPLFSQKHQNPTMPSQDLPYLSTTSRTTSKRISRHPSSKLKRLKSRQRQKAQNAKAGIKLITDMTAFRRQNQNQGHVAHYVREPEAKPVKFVDAAALRALEGEPNSASVGSWNWLKRNKDKSPSSPTLKPAPSNQDQGLSPGDRPIPIAIEDDIESSSKAIYPKNTTTAPKFTADLRSKLSTQPPIKSVWSPDTPDTLYSFNSPNNPNHASSIYSQATGGLHPVTEHAANIPPVPEVPSNYKKNKEKLISLEIGGGRTPAEEEFDTPCTLFEEDGTNSPSRRRKSHLTVRSGITPDSATSRSKGWWDTVVTPFVDKRFTFTSRSPRLESPRDKRHSSLWSAADKKDAQLQIPSPITPLLADTPANYMEESSDDEPTPRRHIPTRRPTVEETIEPAPSSRELDDRARQEKATALFIDTESHQSPGPPPYSPPNRRLAAGAAAAPVRYRAVFPPGHPLQSQFPPSPNPVSPGLANTMTSQGATQLMEIPLTPATNAPLPTRAVGTYVPQEHSHDARGDRFKVERRRRRYEKEDVAARRVGGFWRGRGCIPETGCFGRTGPEGRKRRRICCCVCIIILLLLILIIVLVTLLTRQHHADIPSIWVNLTDYPPMPTGVLTFVGPDNKEASSQCTAPTTLWSCSLPKDDHDSVAPYKPNQPTLIFQIQWDNATKGNWDIPNGEQPTSISKRTGSAASYARSVVQARDGDSIDGFVADPAAPNYQDMWFLGETTDGIQGAEKAGEPTPFFISLLESTNKTVNTPVLNKRGDGSGNGDFGNTPLADLIPKPDLLPDGTPLPAQMLPNPVQQPVRLYDRGLPTEHYGFYTYFDRSIYLKSVTVLNSTDTDNSNVPLDQDGGCSKTEADFLTTWGQTRLLVQIWTRKLNSTGTSLLQADTMGGINGNSSVIRPGTMPWPVTVSLDTHGGDPKKKFVWEWPMDSRQMLNTSEPRLLSNDISIGGSLVNPRDKGDPKYGGYDGGTGGCKCEWVNWE